MQSRGRGRGREEEGRDEVECEVCKNTFLSDSQTSSKSKMLLEVAAVTLLNMCIHDTSRL